MCLAAPMEIITIKADGKALVRQDELELEVDVSLIDKPKTGDYVIVHAGFAINILDLEEAEQRLKLFAEMRNQAPG